MQFFTLTDGQVGVNRPTPHIVAGQPVAVRFSTFTVASNLRSYWSAQALAATAGSVKSGN